MQEEVDSLRGQLEDAIADQRRADDDWAARTEELESRLAEETRQRAALEDRVAELAADLQDQQQQHRQQENDVDAAASEGEISYTCG